MREPTDTIVVMASGPSLGFDDFFDVELVRQSGLFTVTVNTTWKRAPWCDVIFAGDMAWWRVHGPKVTCGAKRWTCSKTAAKRFACEYRGRQIKPGYNSGACAVELAANVYKAKKVIMLGFDGSVRHGVHHHGKHKKTGNPDSTRCKQWRRQFKHMVDICPKTRIVNCSAYTEIDVIDRGDLMAELNV